MSQNDISNWLHLVWLSILTASLIINTVSLREDVILIVSETDRLSQQIVNMEKQLEGSNRRIDDSLNCNRLPAETDD